MGFARSVSFPVALMAFVTILITVAPKTYHYNTDTNYVLSAVDTEGCPLLIKKGDNDNTLPVGYEALPPFLIKCLINQEDRSFFKQNSWLPNPSTWHGISPAMLYRWFIGSGGGSNLNATLIKNVAFDGTFPTDIQRKFAEAMAGLQLSMQLSPQQIVSQYANKVAFGGGEAQSGVAMGALNTFGLPVERLNPAEMLYLVQTIKRGSSFKAGDTLISYANASGNENLIKKALVEQATKWYEQELISKKELNAVKGSELRFANKEYKPVCKTSTIDFLKKQIGKDSSSKTFRSSMSVERQQAVYNGVDEFNTRFKDYLAKNGFTLFTAALVIDPHTGKILAHYGSDNIVDLTTLGNGSDMGSVIKPFVACELLESGFDANRILLYDGPVKGLKTPKDFGSYSFKYLGIDDALAQSPNASFVNIRLITDPIQLYKNVENRFRQMNLLADPYSNLNDDKRRGENILNYPLGSRNMRLLDIAQAYQVLFNQGRYIRLTPFNDYYDPYKDSTIRITQETKQIYKPENADRIKSALHHTMLRGGTAFHLNEILKTNGRMFYAKTGTTAGARDGLCVLTDGNVLVISYLSYGRITNNNLRLGLAEIPYGAAGRSAGVLNAIIFNHILGLN
jgi:membrane peptidoglycan carboxypeptidase